MNNNKKMESTAEAALTSKKLINDTTPCIKSEAEKLFDRIKTDRVHALKVPNRNTDFRELVAEANRNGDCIINNGEGYYRPGPDDEKELDRYLFRELRRAKAINEKVDAMRESYYGRY